MTSINMSYIPLADCIARHVYRLRSRNLDLGVYDGNNGFIGIREKFGQLYLFTEYHHDQGAPYGTVYPLEDVGVLPDHILATERLSHEHGHSWFLRDDQWVPVLRRDLREGEPKHGARRGFVDEWVDTGERLGDNQWPTLRGNDDLFEFLSTFSVDKSIQTDLT